MADSYVNTRTIMGDQEAFDALIAGELEDLVEDGVTNISKSYTVYYNDGIKSIKLPNLANVAAEAVCYNANLEVVDIGKRCTFGSSSLSNNSKLNSLILRGSTMSSHASNLLKNTLIIAKYGAVYVPYDLVATYKANSAWSSYNIYPIEDYPKSDYSTISDSWSEILENESNGTYSTKYAIGDTKKITINNNDYYAQIVAFDADILSDESDNAKITWLLTHIYTNDHVMYSRGNVPNDGWPSSEMRSWLSTDMLPLFPEAIRTAIKEVKKTSFSDSTTGDVVSYDKLWIPSAREVSGSSSLGYESSGPSYTTVFSNSLKRMVYKGSAPSYWWLRSRSRHDNGYFQNCNLDGSISSNYGYYTSGEVIGFCT